MVAKYPVPTSDAGWFSKQLQQLKTAVAEANRRAMHAAQVRSGVVDPSYTTGSPKVTFTGDTVKSGPFQYSGGYTPHASDTVFLVSKGDSWVVLGKLLG